MIPSPFSVADSTAALTGAIARLRAALSPQSTGAMFAIVLATDATGREHVVYAMAGALDTAPALPLAPPLPATMVNALDQSHAVDREHCAAPRALYAALQQKWTPQLVTELWLGPSPLVGGRHDGQRYPVCRGRCGVLVPFLLAGFAVAPPPVFGALPGTLAITTRYEDEWLLAVDKPSGLLSVPGRDGGVLDSAMAQVRRTFPDAGEAHRLDLDTSGLLLVGKDRETQRALHRAFADRAIEKEYLAELDAVVAPDAGTITLPLRLDLDDRPRQIVDFEQGYAATTHYRVLARTATRTRVALTPATGRTHQLRVHAAHQHGLAAPIVGDRLYGRGGDRLLLHATRLSFVHPHTGVRVVIDSPAPFAELW